MAVKGKGFVLRQDKDATQIAVDTVGKRDVNNPVNPAERHRGLRAVTRQRPQPLTLASRQQNADRIAHQGHVESFARSGNSGVRGIESRHSNSNGPSPIPAPAGYLDRGPWTLKTKLDFNG